jgi:hypothetical protein
MKITQLPVLNYDENSMDNSLRVEFFTNSKFTFDPDVLQYLSCNGRAPNSVLGVVPGSDSVV